MRTLSSTLLAAQKKAARLPYVEARIYDYEAGIKRLSWSRLYTGSEPDNHHGIGFDGQGSMHRIRAAAGNRLYYQKVPSPGPSSDYSQWTEVAADCAGPSAIAAYGAKVYIFYRHNELNQLNKLYSHDYGQTWNNAEFVTYADVLSMAAAWWVGPDPQSPTPIVVCFALKSNQLNAITLNSITQETQQHPWSDGNHPLLNTYGIGATYNASLDQCEIVLAGKESDSPYSHYDLFRTKLSNTYNFLALESFLMSPDGEDITYEYPDCHLPAVASGEGGLDYETNRIVAVEKLVLSGGAGSRLLPITCHMVKGTCWSDTTFTEPRPLMDVSPACGLRMATTADYWWMEMPSGVWRAPRPAAVPLDISKDIVSLTQTQSTQGTRRTQEALIIELDNSKGQYAQSALLSKLNRRSELVLKLGYETAAGGEAVEAGTYWIDSWEYQSVSLRGESRSNLSTLSITCFDGRGLMDRWTARHQMRWNKDDVNPKSVWQILYQLLARVGIKLTNTPAKPQSSAIKNFYPDFAIDPGTPGTQALNRLLSFVPDQLVFRGQEAFTKNPLANEASCYSYSTNPSNPTNSHVILSGAYREESHASRALAIGRDADDNRIVEEARDWDLLELAIDILAQDYDPNLTSSTRAQERADALLRTQQTQRTQATIVVPTNVGQELLDVVEVTDTRCGIDQENLRVQEIRILYDHRRGQYDQILTLGAP